MKTENDKKIHLNISTVDKYKNEKTLLYLFFIIMVALATFASYLIIKTNQQKLKLSDLTTEKQKLLAEIKNKDEEILTKDREISDLQSGLNDLQNRFDNLRENYSKEKQRNNEFEDQIDSLSGTLKDLNKLAKTDKELLQKYSKVYFLNENYMPKKLSRIRDEYLLKHDKPQYFHAEAIDYLQDMIKDAERDDIDLKIISAYRSFDEQSALKGQYTKIYGSGANTFSADQGYSEHQLGTTVDLTTPEVGGTYVKFADTKAYKWLQDNAYKYGFVLSYPENNNYYVFEPWHWRFVGKDLARYLHRKDKYFYELDQRKINEYLIDMFD